MEVGNQCTDIREPAHKYGDGFDLTRKQCHKSTQRKLSTRKDFLARRRRNTKIKLTLD
ncbi:MAG: hypothetical protein LH614_02040 [Pyrinomonadaceae bacterium]|nr:hypothetical protein [Pyrinomonadaceae bacterium]